MVIPPLRVWCPVLVPAAICRAPLEPAALKSAAVGREVQVRSAKLESVWLNYESWSFIPQQNIELI